MAHSASRTHANPSAQPQAHADTVPDSAARTSASATAAFTAPPSRKRLIILALLFVTVVINYLDRSNLSIAAPALFKELNIDPVRAGLVFSAFGWTYALMQIPGGWLVDKVSPQWTLRNGQESTRVFNRRLTNVHEPNGLEPYVPQRVGAATNLGG